MGNSNTYKIRAGAIFKRPRKKNKKKKLKVREKSDNFTFRQVEIREALNWEGEAMQTDYFRWGVWFDFVDIKFKIVVSIVGSKGINKEIKDLVLSHGWHILYIKFNDGDKRSFETLLKDLKFIRNKPRYLNKRSGQLNDNLCKSEKWYKAKIEKEPFFPEAEFIFNKPIFGHFIIDLCSEKYRLCVEVDGSIHEEENQIAKDKNKNKHIKGQGFRIIRVKAFDESSYLTSVKLIAQHIEKFEHLGFNPAEDFKDKVAAIDFKKKMPF